MLPLLLAALTSFSQSPNLVENGQFMAGTSPWTITGPSASSTVVDAPAGKGLRIETRAAKVDNPWDVELKQPLLKVLSKGRSLAISFLGRSPNGSRVGPRLQMAASPFTSIMSETFDLGPTWRRYTLEGAPDRDYAGGETALTFYASYAPGAIVEIADVRLEYGQTSGGSLEKPTTLQTNGDLKEGIGIGWYAMGPVTLSAASDGPSGSKALHVRFDPTPGGSPWSAVVGNTHSGRVAAGETVYLRAWMRSSTRSTATVNFEQTEAPNAKSLTQQVRLGPDWREVRFPFIVRRSFAPGESRTVIFLGYAPGEIEVADLRVEAIGTTPVESLASTIDYFGGAPNSDDWRAPALARIEAIRKGDIAVKVLGKNGKPVRNAKVTIEQVRHAFRFGTAGPASRLLADDEDGKRYRETIERLFNAFTFENEMKWGGSTTPEQYERVERALDWLTRRKFQVRGHNLVWGAQRYLPGSVASMDKAGMVDAVQARVVSEVDRYKGRVYLWDAVNEPAVEPWLWDRIGFDQIGAVLRKARERDPGALLCLNEYRITEEAQYGSGTRKRFEEIVRNLDAERAPFEVLGIQAHVGVPLTPIGRVVEILDEMAKLGKRLEITEFDLGGVTDDALHARHTADFLTACFACPQMDGFFVWGFWEGSHWRAGEGGAMFKRDWTPRPSAVAFERLIKKDWWTRYAGVTDATGSAKTRAFYGTHRITVTAGALRSEAIVETVPDQPAEIVVRL